MEIVIFDHRVTQKSPAGSCHLLLSEGLSKEHDFTVFTMSFDGDRSNTRHIRVPAVSQPDVVRFLTFNVAASIRYWIYRRQERRPQLIQSLVPSIWFGDVGYAHFCSTAYLELEKEIGRIHRGFRGWVQRLTHHFRAVGERIVYRKLEHIVVPSDGLKREIVGCFNIPDDRITVIGNPVALERFARPDGHRISEIRRDFHLHPEDLVLVFVALGHFERKGLPQILRSMAGVDDPRLKLMVVGGRDRLVNRYELLTRDLGIEHSVKYFGFQRDIRPFLWAGDAFIFPSRYEAFPLVVLQAAAAELPLLATPVNGVEDVLLNGVNGMLIHGFDDVDVRETIEGFLDLDADKRREMGQRASHSVSNHGVESFVERWADFYKSRSR